MTVIVRPTSRLRKDAHMKDKMEPVVFASVSDLLEKTPEERKDYELRCELINELRNYIEKSGMTQTDVAKALSVAQPRVSDLMRGKVSKFSLGTLLEFMMDLGFHVTIKRTEPQVQAAKSIKIRPKVSSSGKRTHQLEPA